jgi:hypothetical protein
MEKNEGQRTGRVPPLPILWRKKYADVQSESRRKGYRDYRGKIIFIFHARKRKNDVNGFCEEERNSIIDLIQCFLFLFIP